MQVKRGEGKDAHQEGTSRDACVGDDPSLVTDMMHISRGPDKKGGRPQTGLLCALLGLFVPIVYEL